MTLRSRINPAARAVQGETILFVGSQEARLLFPAERVDRIYNTRNGLIFQAGVDYWHEPGSDKILRLPFSRIPQLAAEEIHLPKDAPGIRLFPDCRANAVPGGVDGKALIFDNYSRFAGLQVEVDYQATAMQQIFPEPNFPDRLPRTQATLAQGGAATLTITTLGDSITEGFNASAYTKVQPFQPPYALLLGEMLQNAYGTTVKVHNLGVDGSVSRHAVQEPQRWANDRPDLLVVAYGMNDFSRRDLEGYKTNLKAIIDLAKAARNDTEILLVASMPGNPEWNCTPPGSARLFASALRELVATFDASISMADQSTLYDNMLAHKGFYDLTGNGVNHPNDFAHALLAENICRCLGPRREGF